MTTRKKLFGIGIVAILAMALALGLFVPRLLHAQQGGGMGMGGDCPMMGNSSSASMMEGCPMGDCPMMQASALGPASALEHREELGVTGAQATKLEDLASQLRQQRTQASKQMRGLHAKIEQATQVERFDEAAVRQSFEQMGDAHADLGVALVRAQHAVGEVLTPEQAEQLAQMAGSMGMSTMCMEMMHGGSGMHDCPMMGGSGAPESADAAKEGS